MNKFYLWETTVFGTAESVCRIENALERAGIVHTRGIKRVRSEWNKAHERSANDVWEWELEFTGTEEDAKTIMTEMIEQKVYYGMHKSLLLGGM